MNEHPHDSIPAFVLGALDADEAVLVGKHLAICAACRAEMEAFHTVVAELPYAAPPQEPPPHVKQQLFARIAAGDAPAAASPPAPPAARPSARWMGLAMACSLALALAFGRLLLDARSRVSALATQLQQSQQNIQQLRSRIDQDVQLARFMSARQTVAQRLDGADSRASAVMYMQPASPHAVLVVQGLRPADSGKVYQFWLAKPGVQVPSATFDIGQDGMAMLTIDAPGPLNEYAQVMVTVEQAGGSQQPSNQVVLSGTLGSIRENIALIFRPAFLLLH